MDYKCPKCQQVYAGMLRYCPYCGTTIKYNQYDYMAIDNYSDSKKSRNLQKIGYIGAMMQSCGCILLSIWLLAFLIFIIIIIL